MVHVSGWSVKPCSYTIHMARGDDRNRAAGESENNQCRAVGRNNLMLLLWAVSGSLSGAIIGVNRPRWGLVVVDAGAPSPFRLSVHGEIHRHAACTVGRPGTTSSRPLALNGAEYSGHGNAVCRCQIRPCYELRPPSLAVTARLVLYSLQVVVSCNVGCWMTE